MKLFHNVFIFVVLLFTCGSLGSQECLGVNPNQNNITLSENLEKILQKTITKDKVFKGFNRFLFVGPDMCQLCIDDVVNLITESNSKRKNELCIILLGLDSAVTTMNNLIYRRRAHFIHVSQEKYELFKKAGGNKISGLRIGVKRETNTQCNFYADNMPTAHKVVHFLLNS